MSNKFIYLVFAVAMLFTSCGSDGDNGDSGDAVRNVNSNESMVGKPSNISGKSYPGSITALEYPKLKGGNSIIIVHNSVLNSSNNVSDVNYSVEWDCVKKSQRWSCYKLYKSINATNTTRYTSSDNQYPKDPDLPSAYGFASDPFWNTGYDHGHICPSADRLGSYNANYQTFFLTNMQPQVNGFNAKVWANMESYVRNQWPTSTSDTLYVCKGGTIDNAVNIIKTTSMGLIVPKYFYMALLFKNAEGYKAMGFWIEHKVNSDANLAKYVVNIDELEQKTGIDFFCNLPDDIEDKVESIPVSNILKAWGGLK